MSDALLSVRDLYVSYGSAEPAVRGVSLSVNQGEAAFILGSNGAGKTSLLRGISGFWRSERGRVNGGEVIFDGENITGTPVAQLARRGLVLVPEDNKVFRNVSVKDNLRSVPRLMSRREYESLLSSIVDIFPILGQRMSQAAGYLSGGERQMLAIARALLLAPRLLLVDEGSLGLAPIAIDLVFDKLEEAISALGTTALLVEQNVGVARKMASHVYVLTTGTVVFEGSIDEVMSDSRIQEAYLGVEATP